LSHRTTLSLAAALAVLGACDPPAPLSPTSALVTRRGPKPAPLPPDSTGPGLPYYPAPPLDTLYMPQ
jgi:hypothetical protein